MLEKFSSTSEVMTRFEGNLLRGYFDGVEGHQSVPGRLAHEQMRALELEVVHVQVEVRVVGRIKQSQKAAATCKPYFFRRNISSRSKGNSIAEPTNSFPLVCRKFSFETYTFAFFCAF